MTTKLKWYTEQELHSWLVKNKYSKSIADELAPMLLKNYNSAFNKGVECALRGFVIPITESLPELRKEVLVFVHSNHMGTKRSLGYRSKDKDDPNNINGWVLDYPLEGKVIAWSLLPEMF